MLWDRSTVAQGVRFLTQQELGAAALHNGVTSLIRADGRCFGTKHHFPAPAGFPCWMKTGNPSLISMQVQNSAGARERSVPRKKGTALFLQGENLCLAFSQLLPWSAHKTGRSCSVWSQDVTHQLLGNILPLGRAGMKFSPYTSPSLIVRIQLIVWDVGSYSAYSLGTVFVKCNPKRTAGCLRNYTIVI